MRMRIVVTSVAAVGMVALATTAMGGSAPGTGMMGSDHDGTLHGSPAMCVECHTPHQAHSTLLLWNHDLSSSTFKWDVPATTAGTPFPVTSGLTYQGPSAKCLSCHDGTLATESNEWYNAQANNGTFKCGAFQAPVAWCKIGGLFGTPNANLGGGNMAGTHPVMMPYPTNNLPSYYNGVTTGPGLLTDTYEWVPDPTNNNMRIYTDDGSGHISAAKIPGGAVPGKSGIECGSCHDVHNGVRTQDVFLLTGKITGNTGGPTGGYICENCHNK